MNTKELRSLTVKELKEECRDEELTGYSKLSKDDLVKVLVANNRKKARGTSASVKPVKGKGKQAPSTKGPLKDISFEVESHKTGSKIDSMITCSSGVNSGEFPVVGRSVAEVADFLKEILNVSSMADGLVNGDKAESSYILQEGDTLEFVKPAGSKG
jgi:hypothetical protein